MAYIRIPFGAAGDRSTVPVSTQPDGSVSYTSGYGEDYSLPRGQPNSLNIERPKFNQIMFDLSSVIQLYQQTGLPPFITNSDNGGVDFPYAKSAIINYGGDLYISLTDSNTSAPTNTSFWTKLIPSALGGAATNITVADAASDTTTWVLLAGNQTGSQQALTDAGLTYNASTNVLGADISGNAATITVSDAASDTTTWLMLAGNQTGNQAALTDSGLTYNASTDVLGANISGNAATVPVTDAASDTTTWVMLAANQTGNQAPKTDSGLTYNASTDILGANISGNAETVSTISGLVTQGSNVTITGSGTLASPYNISASASGSAILNVQTFTSGMTNWTKPAVSGTWVIAQIWAGGGAGGSSTSAGGGQGGGGGGYFEIKIPFASVGSTETVGIGTGGAGATSSASGAAGGSSSFGSWCTVFGGGGGYSIAGSGYGGGGGGGLGSTGSTGTNTAGGSGGTPQNGTYSVYGGGDGATSVGAGGPGGNSIFGGGGGGGTATSATTSTGSGGTSVYGGGGGGGCAYSTGTSGAGGSSKVGGNGGAGGTSTVAGQNGATPGGGGGGGRNSLGSGSGGNGKVIVFVI